MSVTGSKSQGVYVVSDAEVAAGTFRVATGPAIRVIGMDAATRGVEGGPLTPVYIVTDPAARGVIGGKAVPMTNLTGIRSPVHDLAIPIYVVEDDGQFVAAPECDEPWCAGGVDPASALRIYNFIGALSREDGYVNLADPGTGDAALGDAPEWEINSGASFDGVAQHLLTGAAFEDGDALIVRYANMSEDGQLFGSYHYDEAEEPDIDESLYVVPNGDGYQQYKMVDAEIVIEPGVGVATGVLSITTEGVYLDGVLIDAWSAEIGELIFRLGIGLALDQNGDLIEASDQGSKQILAWWHYRPTTPFTAPQIAALSAAMAALEAPLLARTLVGYWSLDEASGLPANRVNTAITFDGGSGTPGTAAGKIGNSRTFSSSFFSASDNRFSDIDTDTTSFSVALWFYCASSGFMAGPVSLDGGGGASRSFSALVIGSAITINLYYGALSSISVTLPGYTANAWNLLVFKFDHSTQRLYASQNGSAWVVSASALPSPMLKDAAWLFRVGNAQGVGYTGRADEVGYWVGHALTDAELALLWNGGAGRAWADIHAYTG